MVTDARQDGGRYSNEAGAPRRGRVRRRHCCARRRAGLRRAVREARAGDPRLVRHGLDVEAIRGQTGRLLDRVAATRIVVTALAGFSRKPVELPVRVDRPKITEADLAHTQRLARRILSAPVTLTRAGGGVGLARRQLAKMLVLPPDGLGQILLGGRAANRYFARLDRALAKPARDASFAVDGANIRI